MTSYDEIVKDCIELAEADTRLRNRMVWQYGSVGEYAARIRDAIEEQRKQENPTGI